LKTIFGRFFGKRKLSNTRPSEASFPSASSFEIIDVASVGFPLVPDDYHLQHVGKTAQGNGYWIALQLATEDGDTRDFVAAYVFDKMGDLISCEVVDQGKRPHSAEHTTNEIIQKLKRKVDAKETTKILVKPFSTSFHGHTFGLIIREQEEGDDPSDETLVDAMPGSTLMFYGPWSHCNYDS
jgi:hypothetical protein